MSRRLARRVGLRLSVLDPGIDTADSDLQASRASQSFRFSIRTTKTLRRWKREVYESIDVSTTCQHPSKGLTDLSVSVQALLLGFANDDVAFLSTYDGLLRSSK